MMPRSSRRQKPPDQYCCNVCDKTTMVQPKQRPRIKATIRAIQKLSERGMRQCTVRRLSAKSPAFSGPVTSLPYRRNGVWIDHASEDRMGIRSRMQTYASQETSRSLYSQSSRLLELSELLSPSSLTSEVMPATMAPGWHVLMDLRNVSAY